MLRYIRGYRNNGITKVSLLLITTHVIRRVRVSFVKVQLSPKELERNYLRHSTEMSYSHSSLIPKLYFRLLSKNAFRFSRWVLFLTVRGLLSLDAYMSWRFRQLITKAGLFILQEWHPLWGWWFNDGIVWGFAF